MSALYRVRQFAQATAALIRKEQRGQELAVSYLSPAALALFQAMPRYDRRHALAVARSLVQAGYCAPHLITAALLHDTGKTCGQDGRVMLWHRVLVVLGRSFAPALLEWLGRDPAADEQVARWRRPFYTQRHHAALSARLAQQAGCSPEAIALIHDHENCAQEGDLLLSALQAADSAN